MTGTERWEHHHKLLKKYPTKTRELCLAYSWMNNGMFLDGLKTGNPNQFEFCKVSMEYAPELLLDTLRERSTKPSIAIKPSVLPVRTSEKPACYRCGEKLADSIRTHIDYSIVKCMCGKRWMHQACADEEMTTAAKCDICVKYKKLTNFYHATLLETL